MTLAALWERWSPRDDPMETCTIVTTSANQLMVPIHNRMPVVLEDDAADIWLDPHADAIALGELLVPDPSEDLEAVPVSSYVNLPTHDDAACWA